jgi:hypothetical protein
MEGTVQLIVTGEMEKIALAKALEQGFPDLSFLETQKFDGFTSVTVKENIFKPENIKSNVDKLADALVAAVDPGRTGIPADMAIVIEDSELENSHQADVIIECFRKAVKQCVCERWSNRARQEQCFRKIRERCSFHLFVPMTEAYFFGEPEALKRAGAERDSTVSGVNMNVEEFLVSDDADYLNAPLKSIYWAIDSENRKRHPKHYLQYLCDPAGTKKRKERYRETHGGVRALETIDWNAVLKNQEYVTFLRALFADISARFPDLRNSYSGNCHPLTDYAGGTILRNI